MTHTEDVRRVNFLHVMMAAQEQIEDAQREASLQNQINTPVSFDPNGEGYSLSVCTFEVSWVHIETAKRNGYELKLRYGVQR